MSATHRPVHRRRPGASKNNPLASSCATPTGSNSAISISRRSRAADQPPSLLSKDEARRIAANVAKLSELLRNA